MSLLLPDGSVENAFEIVVAALSRNISWVSPAIGAGLGLALLRWRRIRVRRYGLMTAAATSVAAIALALSIGLATVAASMQPVKNEAVMVVFPPWLTEEDIKLRVFRAGGVAIGELDGMLVYAVGLGNKFLTSLSDEGAWAVLDGRKAEAWFGRAG
jgi:hypothetical protein